jgi:hydroxypyruvate isomerase
MPLQQSFCYPCFLNPEITLDALFAEAKKIGYAATELWFRDEKFDEWCATVKRHGLAIASMCGHKTLGDGLNNPANHDRIEAELRASIDIAVKLGIPGLICFSGNRREGLSDAEGIEITARGLKRIAPYAEQKGINLNIELLNSKVDHAGYQCDHTAWGVAVCDRVGSDRVKLLYDIYHMQIMEGDVIRTIKTYGKKYFGHYHTAGNPGRNDLDDAQELNYKPIATAIVASGHELYVAHEFRPKGNPLAALRAAYTACLV